MFVHDFIELDIPAPVVCRRLLEDDGAWVVPLAEGAYREGEALRVRIGPRLASRALSKQVSLAFEKPRQRGEVLVLPLHWVASGTPGLFPEMDADLEVGPLGEERSQVSFLGRYRPPLGVAGRLADSMLMHRLAESSVRSFLARVGAAIEQAQAAAAGDSQAPVRGGDGVTSARPRQRGGHGPCDRSASDPGLPVRSVDMGDARARRWT